MGSGKCSSVVKQNYSKDILGSVSSVTKLSLCKLEFTQTHMRDFEGVARKAPVVPEILFYSSCQIHRSCVDLFLKMVV